MRTRVLLFCLLLIPGWMLAQHTQEHLDTLHLLQFVKNETRDLTYTSYVYCASSFEDRFTPAHPDVILSPYHRAVAKHSRIKSLSVFGRDSNLITTFGFDTNGVLVAQVYLLPAYDIYHRFSYFSQRNDKLREVRCYYRNDTLLRTDSVFHYAPQCELPPDYDSNAFSKTITYKKGKLLNEQYQYYNTRYQNESELGVGCTSKNSDFPSVEIYNPHHNTLTLARHPFFTKFRADSLYKTRITFNVAANYPCSLTENTPKYLYRGEKFFEATCCEEITIQHGCGQSVGYEAHYYPDYFTWTNGLPAARYRKYEHRLPENGGLHTSEPELLYYIQYALFPDGNSR